MLQALTEAIVGKHQRLSNSVLAAYPQLNRISLADCSVDDHGIKSTGRTWVSDDDEL